MNQAAKRGALVGALAKGVVSQIILSAANFVVGLILLRYASNEQYGYYALVFSGILLLTSLQGAFVGPAMVNRLTRLGLEGRSDLIGGLYAGQRWALVRVVGICSACIVILKVLGRLDVSTAGLLLVALAAAGTALYRQFFRMVSNAYRNAAAALRGDIAYVAILLCGAVLGAVTPAPVIVTVIFMSLGAIAAGLQTSRALSKRERWNTRASPRVWQDIAAAGTWTASGSAAYWAYTQGYNYLIAAALNLTAVTALGSTRMLIMPVALLSTGVSSLMLATISIWLKDHGIGATQRRVALSAAGMAALVLLYAALLWPVRDFVFVRVLHKHLAQSDLMLGAWLLAAMVMAARDQFTNFFLALARYRLLTSMTVLGAIIALAATFTMIGRIGAAGAAIGVLVGELANVLALIVLSRLEVRRQAVKPGAPPAADAIG